MKRVFFFALLLVLASCGSDVVIGAVGATPEPTAPADPTVPAEPATPSPANATPGPTADTESPGSPVQREALMEARVRWQQTRPDSYSITYRQQCECDQGPWRVFVDSSGAVITNQLDPLQSEAEAPYHSVEQIFGAIEAVLDEGRFPVDVEYDAEWGIPRNYIFNEPELPIDGGFVLIVDEFIADPEPAAEPATEREQDRAALTAAIDLWAQAGLDDYDYTFLNSCFCPPEYYGPYRVSVRDGVVVGATYEDVDLFDVEIINIEQYSDLVLTVDQAFAQIEQAIDEADSLTIRYHPELGYPTSVFIDWDEQVADEETGNQIRNLAAQRPECSTARSSVVLVQQPDLPDLVERRRQAIFDAAMACDIEALAALTNAEQFTASFGGGEAAELWTIVEASGRPILLELVQHLNLAYAVRGEGADAFYIWPSAFDMLEASDGTGLDPGDYEELLQLYSVEDLDVMFAGIDAYVGHRIGIDADGNWLYFVEGD